MAGINRDTDDDGGSGFPSYPEVRSLLCRKLTGLKVNQTC